MLARRTNGLHPLGQLKAEMDRLWGDFLSAPLAWQRTGGAGRAFPALNVWEEGDHLVAEAELPGMKTEDVEVAVVGNELTIKGRRGESAPEGVVHHRRERAVGEFTRSLRIPVEVDSSKVQAEMRDGVLRVTLPKAEAAKPRKIKVVAGN